MGYAAIAAAAAALIVSSVRADSPTAAADANADVPTEELRAWDTYTLEPDGRYVHDTDYVTLVRNERGAHERAQIAFAYAESRQTLEVIEAFTETPDGRKIAVPADKILIRESPVAAGAPMFADIKVTTIVFPDVEVNSKLHYRVRRTEKEPLFPGYFNIRDAVPPHGLDDDDRLTVYAADCGVPQRRDRLPGRGHCLSCG